jgi:PncC family amidohydrolase
MKKENKAVTDKKTVKKRAAEESAENNAVTDKEIARVLNTLRERGESVTTVESLTAGMISARLADIPGCSDVLERAFVTYCDEAKHEMVNVKKKTLKKWTAVSRQCAKQMAKGGAKKAGAQACVSATGYAGPPSGPDDTSVGQVFLGCFYRGEISVEEHRYTGERNEVRTQAMNDALHLLMSMVLT